MEVETSRSGRALVGVWPRMPPACRVAVVAAVVVGASSQVSQAHELELTEVHVTFARDGTYRVDVMNDPGWLLMRVEPFSGLGLSGRLDPPARDLRLAEMEATFAEWVHLYFDGTRVATSVSYLPPTEGGPTAPDGTSLGVMRLVGHVPPDASTFSFAYGLIMDPYPVLVRDRHDQLITYWNVGEYETEAFLLAELMPPTLRQIVMIPLVIAVGAVGVYLTVTRVLAGGS